MAGQSVWHRDDIARIAATLMAMAPSLEFGAGVMALATALGAPVRVPRQPVAATLDAIAVEVIR